MRSNRLWLATVLLVAAPLFVTLGAFPLPAQNSPAASDPATALADALVAACRQDAQSFAAHLTAPNAAAFLTLPAEQRRAVLRRFILLDDPGKPLRSNDLQGNTVLRCDAEGVLSEVRFGPAEVHDNLAFIPVTFPQAVAEARTGRLGLVREDGQWKLLSLGLLLLDIPALAHQWEQTDLEERESHAVDSMRKIASALTAYQQAYGHLPDELSNLGAPGTEGASPEKAGMLDSALAAGEDQGYRFRYNIVPVGGEASESDRDKAAGFQLAATPVEYGKDGRKSFYLDSGGTLRGSDRQGAVATNTDPRIAQTEP